MRKKVIFTKICPQCHHEFKTTSTVKKYCCKFCADKFNHDRYRQEGRTQQLAKARKEKLEKQKIKDKQRKAARFDAIAIMQSETGISGGKLKMYWHNKAKLAAYVAVHRTR